MKRLLTIMFVAIGAGCTVGKDYQRPKLEVEKTYGQAATQPSPATADTQQWWKTLNDPMLDDLVARAIKSNLDLKMAAARLREARAYRQVVGADQYPQLSVGASYTRERLSKNAAPYNAFNAPDFPWAFDAYNIGFDASWEVDVFGGTRRAVEAAGADVQARAEAQRGVMLSVIGEVGRNYVELRGYQRGIEIARENLILQQETLRLARDRQTSGLGTDLDVVRVQAQVAVTQAMIPQFTSQQWQAIHRIAVLLGEDIEPVGQQLIATKPIPVPPTTVPVGVPAELLRRRPDIRMAERQLAAASARTGVAEADLYPHLQIGGQFGLTADRGSNLFERDSRGYSIGPSISWPIFDGGRVRGMIKVRSAQQEQAMIAYEATVRRAIAEVRDALVQFTQEHQRRQSLVEAEKANASSVAMSQQLYTKGLSDFLGVLDAQRALLLTQDAVVKSEMTESTALIAVYKALGGGWEEALPEKPTTRSSTR